MPPLPTQTHGPTTGHPILILPGWEMTPETEMHDFEPIFTTLPSIPSNTPLRRIYIALPGTASTPARNITSLDDIYHHLVHFIDNTLGDSRFMLVGSSCGAYLARALAQRFIHQIDGLLLRVPLVEPEDAKRDVDRVEPLVRDEKLMDGLDEEDRTLLGGRVMVQTEGYVGELVRKYREVYVPAEEGADKGVLDKIRGDVGRYRLSEELLSGGEKLMAPTLVVCGRQDEIVGYRDCLGLLEKYPRATFAVLDRGTHGLPVDESERGVFGALVRDWVFRVGEWRDSHY
ncbi:alpha/beta fold hydrolase [Aspergillus vadensis CBS 113365]|uniref:Alpha/beta-hydrolase n=1 Tax=Aspergillus vadensis (strain CBS 113365 / IMI 142717 / IBT 24658) TaxID=1448311 RepID=A0A319C4Z1_ASPVC|nr:alpha/beta-hydrolase [Aspergillus vadensis CBS 113365]PYH70508.1 alpha/beta-hydrolase [Aspergillus vadensis CBS 113365]